MLRNYFTLYHLASELDELLKNGYVFEVFSQQRNEITISLITNKGNHLQLVVVTGHPRFCIYTREGLNRKQRNTVDLMPEIAEKKIAEIIIDPRDRIIRLRLEDNYVIVLQLFSAKTNVLLEKNGMSINAFKHGPPVNASEKKESCHEKPEILRSLEPLVYDRALFSTRFSKTPAKDLRSKLIKMLPGFDRKLTRELIDRCDNNHSAEHIHTEFATLFYELLDPHPVVYIGKDDYPEFSILHNSTKTSTRLETIQEGLNLYSGRTWQFLKTRELVGELDKKLHHKMTKIERELALFRREKLRKQAEDYERNGHLIMANLYNTDHQKNQITVKNIFNEPPNPITISLKPEMTLQQNAAAWFRKASKAKEKIEGGIKRKNVLEKQKHELARLIELSSNLSTPSQVRNYYQTNHSLLQSLGIEHTSKKEKKPLPFKVFSITQKAVLYVGKNAKNNEELTFSFAKPHDIWLHARGAAGSHCILRGATMQNITEIEKAAEIAAFYSSAKHSELVPVMYSEKKYIRRARNMPIGQVLAEKEKVIMVRPASNGF